MSSNSGAEGQSASQTKTAMPFVASYLVFGHGAEVIVSEEHAQLSFLNGGCQLTQAMVS